MYFYLMKIGMLLGNTQNLVLQVGNIVPSRFIFEQYNKFYLSFFRRPLGAQLLK